ILAVTLIAVIGVYYYLYKDSFRKPRIQISHTIRPQSWALAHKSADASDDDLTRIVIFGMEQDYKLTSVKVIAIPELETNKYAHPIWELTSDSNSVPVRAFNYGGHVRGMHPPVKGAQPGALAMNVPYRLFIEAGPMKGVHDFTVTAENHVAQ
ncbi:MAG: hypothetical protein JWQ04_1479, partial [Pedosphaera sp.]|nr:hypothetical protein [Pedosphaera sp.]